MIVVLILGIILLVSGILAFVGKTFLGRLSLVLSGFTITNELIGVLLFFVGIVCIVSYLIPIMEPHLLIDM